MCIRDRLQALGNRCDDRRTATQLGEDVDEISSGVLGVYDRRDSVGSEMDHTMCGLRVSLAQIPVRQDQPGPHDAPTLGFRGPSSWTPSPGPGGRVTTPLS